MCGRINLRTSPAELAEFFELFREPVWAPRYNLGPMQQILIVRHQPEGTRLAEPVQWGLVPIWAKDPAIGSKMNNARSETITEKPAFRSVFRKRRCLIPASGFYEWQQTVGKTKQPWHIFRADGTPLIFAGLWDHWQAVDGAVLESCAVVTTEANQFMSEIHTRMPVILSKEMARLWIDQSDIEPAALTELMLPCPDDWLAKTPVSTLVNNVRNESPECIQPVKLPRTLF